MEPFLEALGPSLASAGPALAGWWEESEPASDSREHSAKAEVKEPPQPPLLLRALLSAPRMTPLVDTRLAESVMLSKQGKLCAHKMHYPFSRVHALLCLSMSSVTAA